MSNRYLAYAPNTSSGVSFVAKKTQSASTAVSSYSEGSWWTEEEARLYEQWATSFEAYGNVVNPYFNYFFTGQDIKVKIDALDDNEFLPIYAFGYQIQQEKTPIYGAFSYTYDAMLRGTRIISGAFSLVVTEPQLLMYQIAKSAGIRARTSQAQSTGAYSIRLLDGDEANIERYWKRTYDNNKTANENHLFSIHPPFNFLIKYGIQETSLYSNNPNLRVDEIKKDFASNSAMFTNTNERLVQNDNITKMPSKILLENIELTSKSVEFDSSGDPILETYTFLARDERIVANPDTMNVPNQLPQTTAAGGNLTYR